MAEETREEYLAKLQQFKERQFIEILPDIRSGTLFYIRVARELLEQYSIPKGNAALEEAITQGKAIVNRRIPEIMDLIIDEIRKGAREYLVMPQLLLEYLVESQLDIKEPFSAEEQATVISPLHKMEYDLCLELTNEGCISKYNAASYALRRKVAETLADDLPECREKLFIQCIGIRTTIYGKGSGILSGDDYAFQTATSLVKKQGLPANYLRNAIDAYRIYEMKFIAELFSPKYWPDDPSFSITAHVQQRKQKEQEVAQKVEEWQKIVDDFHSEKKKKLSKGIPQLQWLEDETTKKKKRTKHRNK